ncbi:FliM/FliN family flagellar motor switch protein [Roseibacterium sp. SDUM158017]|uniref:FliM/FliN family flagellar motor switch protein n=1 Tax=Roseicyclus salinarum TaxID=3036773 RepID=UPI002414F794|nr:FliM/FliN family flagellar motor switch protein [Roseibacterium sp. SDUM158017]MDG4648632.1 FliM/FliN family flagellar motor switch protein [Roseibacterium sp. SDUM158017]
MIRAAEGQPARLGRLDDALAAFAKGVGRTLAEFSGADVVPAAADIRYVTSEEARGVASGIIASAEARPWTGAFFVGIERPLMAVFLGRILGDEPEDADTDRPLTPIERRIALRLLDRAVGALSAELASLRKVTGHALELKHEVAAADLGAAGDRCVVAVVPLEAGGATGALHVILPFSLFGPDLDMLARPVRPRAVPEATGWREELSTMIACAQIKVTAIIGEGEVRLGDALAWKLGETLDLGIDATQPASIACSGRTIFRGEAGRRANGAMALQITEELETGEFKGR